MSQDIVRQLEAMNARTSIIVNKALALTDEEGKAFSQMPEQTLDLMRRLFETGREDSDAHRH